MTATYPYASKDRLVASDLNLDLELSPGATPPASAVNGGAHMFKQWIDTSVSPAVLRMCVANPASPTYNAPDWIALGSVDVANKRYNLVSVYVSDTPPSPVLPGTLWWDSVGLQLYVFYQDPNSSQWVPATNISNSQVIASPTPPASPVPGELWFDTADGVGQLYCYFNDGNSSQWVIANSAAAGPNWLVGSGLILNQATKPSTISLAPGVTDGSNAAAGQVGEYLQNAITTAVSLGASNTNHDLGTLVLGPGDWEVWGQIWFSPSANAASVYYAWINTVSATSPSNPGAGGSTVVNLTGGGPATGGSANLVIMPYRNNLTAASTTFYLSAGLIFSSGTATATGLICARRMR